MENFRCFKAFFAGLEKYPAFAGAVSVLLALGAIRQWQVAFLLCLWVYVLTDILRRVSFIVCALILTSYFLQKDEFSFAENPPQYGHGYVEETLNRPSGYAVIVQTEFGKARLAYSGSETPLPGDSIFWRAKWFPAEPPSVPGAFNGPRWMQSQGYRASGIMDSLNIVGAKNTLNFHRASFLLKQKLEQRFSRFYEKPESGLLMGLLLGDRSGISEALQSDFRRTGLVHVLSISGYHIVMLAGMLTLFLRSFCLPRRVSQALSIIIICVYAPITGGSAAVWRAALMFCVIESAGFFQKPASSINALGVALTLILLFSPAQVFDAGFQLSAAATLGILLSRRFKMPRFRGKAARFLFVFVIEPSFVTLAATLSTLPLLVFHFQAFSPVSWLGNLAVVPLVGLGMQAGVLSLMGVHPFVCQVFADSATILLRSSSEITRFLAENPYASRTVGPWPLALLFAISVFILSLPFLKGQKWGKRIALVCLLLCACFLVGSEIKTNLFPSWSATFLDVGQGDCVLLRSPAGRFYLIDTGPPLKKRSMAREKIIPYLRSQGISELEAIMVSHPHADHYGNAADIIKEFPAKELWTTACAQEKKDSSWQAVLETARSKGVRVKNLRSGLSIKEELLLAKTQWNLTVLYPDSSFCRENQNENSLAIKVSGLGQTLLLTGDLEKHGEKALLPLEIKTDVLKLGHHGSKTSSARAFLERTAPDIAIVSASQRNIYRHPSKDVMERLDSLGIKHCETSKKGSVMAEFKKDGRAVYGYKGKWSFLY